MQSYRIIIHIRNGGNNDSLQLQPFYTLIELITADKCRQNSIQNETDKTRVVGVRRQENHLQATDSDLM